MRPALGLACCACVTPLNGLVCAPRLQERFVRSDDAVQGASAQFHAHCAMRVLTSPRLAQTDDERENIKAMLASLLERAKTRREEVKAELEAAAVRHAARVPC